MTGDGGIYNNYDPAQWQNNPSYQPQVGWVAPSDALDVTELIQQVSLVQIDLLYFQAPVTGDGGTYNNNYDPAQWQNNPSYQTQVGWVAPS